MRNNSFARLVIASLGVSVAIAAGCADPPTAPTRGTPLNLHASMLTSVSISPTEGSNDGTTIAKISGIDFQSATTVTVDGRPVDATVVDAKTISLTMPAHAVGKVDVSVIRAPGQAAVTVRGGFSYFGPPAILELFPNVVSTSGGAQLFISGSGFRYPLTLTIGGVVTPFGTEDWDGNDIYFSVPAHSAGPVDVVVTNPDGRSASGVFTYASPDTFDFNGEWEGWSDPIGASDRSDQGARVVLTIRDNAAVSVTCTVCRPGQNCVTFTAPTVMLDPSPAVANGEFSFADSGGVSITGKILSHKNASGTINVASCGNRTWSATKK